MILWGCAKTTQGQAPVGVSAECIGGDVGRPLVAIDHSRHDAAGGAELQAILAVLRRHRDEYLGRSPAEADGLRDHRGGTRPIGRTQADLPADRERNPLCAGPHRNGSAGSRARRYGQSSARPTDAREQAEVYSGSAATLGQSSFPPYLTAAGLPFPPPLLTRLLRFER